MDIVSYVTSLIDKGTMGAYISLGILCTVAGFILSGIFFGLRRGIAKTTLRLITVLLSAVAAFIIVNSLTGYVQGFFVGKSIEEIISQLVPSYTTDVPEQWRNLIACFDAETAERLVLLLVHLVAVPILFIVIFYVLKLLTNLIYLLLAAILGMMGKRGSLLSSLAGMLVGALQGALIALVIMIPVSGFLGIAREVRAPLTSEEVPADTSAQVDEFYGWWLDDATDNPILGIVDACGGSTLFDNMITARVGEESVNMGEEAKSLTAIFVDAIPLTEGSNFMEPDAKVQSSLRRILEDIGDDRYTAEIISGVLRGAARAINTGVMEVPLGEPYSSLVMELATVLETSDADNLEGDLNTLLNVYFILGDHGLITAMSENSDDMIDLLIGEHDGERVINLITGELDKNARTKPISDAMTKITIMAMSNNMNMDAEQSAELYDNVKTGINEVLQVNREDYESDTEYKSAVSEKLDTTLTENGIELEPEVLDGMAQYVVDNFADTTEITDEDINNALLSYYDAYAEYINSQNGTTPDTPTEDEGEPSTAE